MRKLTFLTLSLVVAMTIVTSVFLCGVGLAEEDCTKITRNFNYDGEAAYHACRAANTLEKLAERMEP